MADGVNLRILGPVVLGFSFVFGVAGLLIYRLWDPRVEPETGYSVRGMAPLPDDTAGVASSEPPDPLRNPAKPSNEYEYLRLLEQYKVENKSMALELAFAGEDWYGDEGPGAEARRAMQVTLLAHVGRTSEAQRLARRFVLRFPESSYLPDVNEVLDPASAASAPNVPRGEVSLTNH